MIKKRSLRWPPSIDGRDKVNRYKLEWNCAKQEKVKNKQKKNNWYVFCIAGKLIK